MSCMLKINEKLRPKLKALADFEKESLNEVLNNVIGEGISCYERRNGTFYLLGRKDRIKNF